MNTQATSLWGRSSRFDLRSGRQRATTAPEPRLTPAPETDAGPPLPALSLGAVCVLEGHRLAIGGSPGTWAAPIAAGPGVVVLRVAPNAPAEPGPWEPRQLDARGRVRLTHGEAALLGSDRVLVCRTGSGNEVVVLTGAALASPLTPRLLATVLGSVDA